MAQFESMAYPQSNHCGQELGDVVHNSTTGEGLVKGLVVSRQDVPERSLAGVVQLVGASSSMSKCCGFNIQSGHIPRFWVQSPDGCVWEATN